MDETDVCNIVESELSLFKVNLNKKLQLLQDTINDMQKEINELKKNNK
jgi:hypothetical protein